MPVQGICHAYKKMQLIYFLYLSKMPTVSHTNPDLSSCYLLPSFKFIGGMSMPLQAFFDMHLLLLLNHTALPMN